MSNGITIGERAIKVATRKDGMIVRLDHGIEDGTAREFYRVRIITHDGRDVSASLWARNLEKVKERFDHMTNWPTVLESTPQPPAIRPEGWGRFG